MSATSMIYEEDSDNEGERRKIIAPNRPHKTSLEVEEVATHRYTQDESGGYAISEVFKRGNHGIIEEPADSDGEWNSDRYSDRNKLSANRGVSILSLSEDDATFVGGNLSRDLSLNDVNNLIFDFDDTKRMYSRENYVRQASFQEESFSESGEISEKVISEKLHRVIEKDMSDEILNKRLGSLSNGYSSSSNKTEYIHTSEYEISESVKAKNAKNTDFIFKQSIDDFGSANTKSKVNHEFDLPPTRSKITFTDDEDDEMEDLFRRIKIQRNNLGDILSKEGQRKNDNYSKGFKKTEILEEINETCENSSPDIESPSLGTKNLSVNIGIKEKIVTGFGEIYEENLSKQEGIRKISDIIPKDEKKCEGKSINQNQIFFTALQMQL